ncbi:hypothetical protein [Planomonospora venezuelensis]|uniref:Acetyltransferase (GNAT) domain-containing protein n=1 Tax=Planomonospora venezuelensis TaxID=1999 RepID=A0A841D806_PLAVE|nr:hypothetical protein [Planomonospora venezuelensis]MBB5964677.1 hypothetical protein [Planomonospora venezuelensis]GIN03084.1 hypothetical protein Pve01_47420 [Planomonospora venezuelensis]
MSLRFDVPVLHGSLVRLEPLAMGHAPDLARAAEEDRSSYRFTAVPRAAEVDRYLEDRLSHDAAVLFAQVRVRDGAAVGCTGRRARVRGAVTGPEAVPWSVPAPRRA